MIELQGVSFGYTGHPVLRDVSLQFPQGEITALVGPNGCGKSTLLKICAGLLRPEVGVVRLGGMELQRLKMRERAGRVGVLLQTYPPTQLTVRQVVLAGRTPHHNLGCSYTKADRDAAQEAMGLTGCLHLADIPLSRLSGGERQRALLAMVLAQQTEILLLDEPTTALDVGAALEVMRLVVQLQREQEKTVVLVLHDLDIALRCAHQVTIMENGRPVWQGPPRKAVSEGSLEKTFQVKPYTFCADGQVFYSFSPLKSQMI